MSNERVEQIQNWRSDVGGDMAGSRPVGRPADERPTDERGRPGSGGRAIRVQDASSRFTDVSDGQEVRGTGDVQPQEPESSGQEAAAQDDQTPGEGEARVRQHEHSPEGSAGPSRQVSPPRPREAGLATPNISPAHPGMFQDNSGEGPQRHRNDRRTEGSTTVVDTEPSLPDIQEPSCQSEPRSRGEEASVRDDPAPLETEPTTRDSHEAGSREASVHDDLASPETAIPAGDSPEAGSSENVEGRSIPDHPPAASSNQTKP